MIFLQYLIIYDPQKTLFFLKCLKTRKANKLFVNIVTLCPPMEAGCFAFIYLITRGGNIDRTVIHGFFFLKILLNTAQHFLSLR